MTEQALNRAAMLGNQAGESAAYWAIQDLGLDYCRESAREAAEVVWANTWHQLELAV